MEMEEGREDNVAALAKESARKDAGSRIPAIPLTVLAPLIIVLTLIGSLVPAYVYLVRGMNDAVNLLSAEYLNGVMNNVNLQIVGSSKRLEPIAQYFAASPDVRASLVGTMPNGTLQTAPWVSQMVNIYYQTPGVDVIAITAASWKPGFGPGSPIDTTHVQLLQASTFNIGKVAFYRYDYESAVLAAVYNAPAANASSYAITTLPYNHANLFAPSIGMRQLLNDPTVVMRRNLYFNVFIDNSHNTTIAYTSMQSFANATATVPDYYCSVGQRVDVTWNNILRGARPNNDSLVAVFKQDWSVGGSSAESPDNTGRLVPGYGYVFTQTVVDPLTQAFQQYLNSTYNVNFFSIATEGITTSDVVIAGTRWVRSGRLMHMSSYTDQDYLLVTAIPRSDVYGSIDHSRTQALSISLGIASAMAVLSVILFILVVIPLFKLARAMGILTKLDFGQLEKSNILDDRSFIWEVRKVQEVFGLMVKAFAGGLKRNKAMVSAAIQESTSSGNTRRKASEASPLMGQASKK
ncbi:hypothetical protein HDU87_000026 [Geranomyces variabilis]|uniref:Uncharacterized protein n=1 Tax=Geranomyces variabilis TaxID=109894 RepID=A0AAD5TS81_9FUNG|nr:hypothetical protein HDU87_000026 [Geranomyces variabilis]